MQLCEHVELAGFARVQFQAELAQADFAQAAVDDVQRCNLLGHEEHAPALRQRLGDQVGDGLALSGAGWADQHKILALRGGQHGRQLRGVCRQGAEHLLGVEVLVQFTHLRERSARWIGIARGVQQVAHDRVFAQLLAVLGQVFPHQVFGEREHGQHHVLGDFPALDVLDGVADDFPDRSDIKAGLVSRQCTFEGA